MRWGPRPDPADWRVIGVTPDTHVKLKRIRDQYQFSSIAAVVDMLTRRLA